MMISSKNGQKVWQLTIQGFTSFCSLMDRLYMFFFTEPLNSFPMIPEQEIHRCGILLRTAPDSGTIEFPLKFDYFSFLQPSFMYLTRWAFAWNSFRRAISGASMPLPAKSHSTCRPKTVFVLPGCSHLHTQMDHTISPARSQNLNCWQDGTYLQQTDPQNIDKKPTFSEKAFSPWT